MMMMMMMMKLLNCSSFIVHRSSCKMKDERCLSVCQSVAMMEMMIRGTIHVNKTGRVKSYHRDSARDSNVF